KHDEEHRGDDKLHRLHLRALMIGATPDTDRAVEHGLQRVDPPWPPRPATSKKVYEMAMLVTSFGSFGSTTNTTGMRRRSPGPRVCWLKQKHSSFLKYSPAIAGPQLGTACAVTATGWSLRTSYSTVASSPGCTSLWFTSGL